jgi:hypothetical protein
MYESYTRITAKTSLQELKISRRRFNRYNARSRMKMSKPKCFTANICPNIEYEPWLPSDMAARLIEMGQNSLVREGIEIERAIRTNNTLLRISSRQEIAKYFQGINGANLMSGLKEAIAELQHSIQYWH